jgi:ectoine hydroxylase-related dioxygenase (phytanoyl-CoA dioxygenase family)
VPDAPRADLALAEGERGAYTEDGFFVRERAFAPAELEALRGAAERAVERAAAAEVRDEYTIDGNRYREAGRATIQFEHRSETSTIRVIEPFHHLDPLFDALVDDARVVEPMRGLVGADRVALWTDKLNLKRPREGSGFRWHQDSPYWAHVHEDVGRLPNAMLALDDADAGNGCFRVVRGSHRRGCLPGLQDEGRLGPLFTDPRHFDLSRQVPIEVPAGSLVFFSPHTVHGSEPNRSDRPRRALVLTYQAADRPMFKVERVRNAEPRRA